MQQSSHIAYSSELCACVWIELQRYSYSTGKHSLATDQHHCNTTLFEIPQMHGRSQAVHFSIMPLTFHSHVPSHHKIASIPFSTGIGVAVIGPCHIVILCSKEANNYNDVEIIWYSLQIVKLASSKIAVCTGSISPSILPWSLSRCWFSYNAQLFYKNKSTNQILYSIKNLIMKTCLVK